MGWYYIYVTYIVFIYEEKEYNVDSPSIFEAPVLCSCVSVNYIPKFELSQGICVSTGDILRERPIEKGKITFDKNYFLREKETPTK